MNDDIFPALYHLADKSAASTQKYFYIVFFINLLILIIASILSMIDIETSIFAIAQAVVLFISLGLIIYLSFSKPQQSWYGARALAESVKTVTWKYMMRAEPFHENEHHAKAQFIDNLRKILGDNQAIFKSSINTPEIEEVTQSMQEERAKSLAERKLFYKKNRILNQQEWYRKKSIYNKVLSKRWFWALIIVTLLAFISSLCKIAWVSKHAYPTDVFTITATSILAWLQVKKYNEVSATYALTSHEIGLLKQEMPEDDLDSSFSSFVDDAENAFSREHTQWQARRNKD